MSNLNCMNEGTPRGLIWYRQSCAYDAVITPIYNLWVEACKKWSEEFNMLIADYLGTLAANFSLYKGIHQELEKCCKIMQQHLVRDWPNDFMIYDETCLYTLLLKLFKSPSIVSSLVNICLAGHQSDQSVAPSTSWLTCVLDDYHSLQDFVHRNKTEVSLVCCICHGPQIRKSMFNHLPPLLVFDLSHHPEVAIDHHLVVTSINQNSAHYRLKGIIYYNDHHFTSCFILCRGVIWFHNGPLTCYGTASCLISSRLINHASPILSNELSNTYLISVWLLWNSSLFNLLHFIIVWFCGHYYKV